MLELSNDLITVMIDPERGASIDHIGASKSHEDNVLARYDWRSPNSVRTGPGYGNTAMDWLADFRGGWQVLTPSAGAESTVGGVLHPFHGDVSRANWNIVASNHESATLNTGTHGPLEVSRTVRIDSRLPKVFVSTTIRNDTPVAAPAIFVEHIAFVGHDEATIEAPAESRWVHDPNSPEAEAGSNPVTWAQSGLQQPISRGNYRLVSLHAGSEGWAELRTTETLGKSVRVEWDPKVLPHMWHWQERGTPSFPWYSRADITAIEPSSVLFSDGLEAAIDRGDAWMIQPGEQKTVDVSIELLPATTRKE